MTGSELKGDRARSLSTSTIEPFGVVSLFAGNAVPTERKERIKLNDESLSVGQAKALKKKRKREAKERYEEAIASHNSRREISGAMIYALYHPLRREVLRVLHDAAKPISPREMSEVMGWDLQTISFHVQVLRERNLARCTRTRSIRGATEHFYVSRVAKNELLASILAGTKKDDRRLFEGP